MSLQRFDQFYLTICKEVGGIQKFVESFFDFLSRKTDFFYQSFPGDKMGFPPGYNKQLIFSIMDKFQKEHYKKIPQRTPEQFNKRVEEAKKNQIKQKNNQKNLSQKQQKTLSHAQTAQTPVAKVEEKQKIVEELKKESKLEPVVSTYNGGKNDKYIWSQQIKQVQVAIEINPSITAKQLKVQLKSTSISIRKNTGQIIIEGDLVQKINAGDSMWKIQQSAGKNFITLNLEKAEEKIWSTVFKGDPQIDTTKVNNTKPLQDFDDQTQGAIRKIMYQQQRKQMGLPTTEEEKQLDALKLAWNAEGSPFKGQPFDPSLVNLTGSQFNP